VTATLKLTGKTAVVTGSGRGIGRALALALARDGAHVALVARTRAEIDEAAVEARKAGSEAVAIVADVTDWRQVEMMASQVRRAFPRLDILVNNAGGAAERQPIAETDPRRWVEDVTLNLVSPYLVTRALLPWLIECGGGRIINVGSGMGHRPGAGSSAYRVGKAGLWMLTQCLAEELWMYGIEVNELIPGPVHTTLTAARFASTPPPFAPSERVKTPDEVVPLALWLASQPPGGPTAQSFSLARRPL
jgi:3-oxoacyl-[acyl-carrier protein] reductase